ncbi:MAG: hypothetical protein IJW04_03470 [Ruminococcus sp.]|nr:hypothetical protein [Ruminococcus sp.]
MANKSRTQYSILNIVTGIGGYAVNTLVGFVCRMIFVRCLSAEYLGINGLFSNILSVLSLAELGVGYAIIYSLYKPIAENDQSKIASIMRYFGRAYSVIGCVIAVAGVAMIPFLDFVVRDQPNIKENLYVIYLLFLFNTVITYFFSYRASLLTAAQQNYLATGLNYIFTIFQSVIQIVFLLITKEYMTYLVTQIIISLCYNITISYIAKRKYPYIVGKGIPPLERTEKKKLTSNIKNVTIWKLAGVLVNNTDNIIITYFSGMITVGYASNYTLFSGMINTLLTQMFNSVIASVGNYNAVESKENKLKLFNSINFANFWLFGWAAIGIFLVSGDLVALLYGGEYVLPMNIPFIIALNFYMVGMQNAVWTFKHTIGIFKQGRYVLFFTAAINLVLSIALGKIWGLFGILFATAISRACTNTWYDPYAVFKYGLDVSVREYFKKYFIYALILIICGAGCYFACSFINFGLALNVILKIIICTVIPNGLFWIVFHKRPEFEFFARIFKRIVNKVFKRKSQA